MKKLVLTVALFSFAISSNAQENDKANKKIDKANKKMDKALSKGKFDYSTTTPKKVEAAFQTDYPEAQNVAWSKYKGDYTAAFTNGTWKSTAVYHANGERRDTRTAITRPQLPTTIVWDDVFKRDNLEPRAFIQIERPSQGKIFRIIAPDRTVTYYDESGNKVEYDY